MTFLAQKYTYDKTNNDLFLTRGGPVQRIDVG